LRLRSAERWNAPLIGCTGLGPDYPSDAGDLGGQSDRDLVLVHPALEPVEPWPQSVPASVEMGHAGSSAMDNHPSQVLVATLADAKQLGLPAGRVFAGHKSQPSGELTGFAALASWTCCRAQGRRGQWA